MSEIFEFCDGSKPSCLRVSLPSDISSKKRLFDSLYAHLFFHGYFGFNWDALNDCLKDLSWIKCHRLYIFHEALPQINDKDLIVYMEILKSSIDFWHERNQDRLHIGFNCSDRERVIELLNAISRQGSV